MYFCISASPQEQLAIVREYLQRNSPPQVSAISKNDQSDTPEGMTEAEFKNLQFQSTQANKISGITSKSILLPGIQLHHHFPSLLHIILGLVNALSRSCDAG